VPKIRFRGIWGQNWTYENPWSPLSEICCWMSENCNFCNPRRLWVFLHHFQAELAKSVYWFLAARYLGDICSRRFLTFGRVFMSRVFELCWSDSYCNIEKPVQSSQLQSIRRVIFLWVLKSYTSLTPISDYWNRYNVAYALLCRRKFIWGEGWSW